MSTLFSGPNSKFILCCIYFHVELTGCALWDVWGDDSVIKFMEFIHSFWYTSQYLWLMQCVPLRPPHIRNQLAPVSGWGHNLVHSFFLLHFTVSVANAVPPTQPSSYKEPADSGEWVGT